MLIALLVSKQCIAVLLLKMLYDLCMGKANYNSSPARLLTSPHDYFSVSMYCA